MVIIKSNWFLFTALILAFIISSSAVSENFGENAEANKTQQIEVYTSFENAYRTAVQVAAERN
jgi:hypothetical protein